MTVPTCYTRDDSSEDSPEFVKSVTTAGGAESVVARAPEDAATIGVDVAAMTRATLFLGANTSPTYTVNVYLYNRAAGEWFEDVDSRLEDQTTDLTKEIRVAGVDRLAVRITAIAGAGASVKRALSLFKE